MGDKTYEEFEEFYLRGSADELAGVFTSVSGGVQTWNDRCATSHHNSPSSLTRMTFDTGTTDRISKVNDKAIGAGSKAALSFALPSAQEIQAERLYFEAEFKSLLSKAGITEYEFGVIIAYISQINEWNKELKKQGKSEIKLTEDDIIQRILATRPQEPRFPGTIDPRGYNVGLFPRTTVAIGFLAADLVECLKPENTINCIGECIIFLLKFTGVIASFMLDLTPVIGNIKGLIESYTGEDLITHQKLPMWARVLGASLAAIPSARAFIKLTLIGAKAVKVSAKGVVKPLIQIAFFAALAHKTPAETMRLIKNVATLDETALKLALKEAEKASGGLKVSRIQISAAQGLGKLLPLDGIANIQRTAAAKASKPITGNAARPVGGNKIPDLPDALPVRDAGRSGSRSGRKPKPKPKGKTDLSKPGAMKEVASKIHGIEKLKGQTVAIVEMIIDGKTFYGAATNSRRGWSIKQSKVLKAAGIKQIESVLREVVHAEVNVLSWVNKLKKEGKKVQVLRWGVSSGRLGHYICDACRTIIDSLGGVIEEFSALGKTY